MIGKVLDLEHDLFKEKARWQRFFEIIRISGLWRGYLQRKKTCCIPMESWIHTTITYSDVEMTGSRFGGPRSFEHVKRIENASGQKIRAGQWSPRLRIWFKKGRLRRKFDWCFDKRDSCQIMQEYQKETVTPWIKVWSFDAKPPPWEILKWNFSSLDLRSFELL